VRGGGAVGQRGGAPGGVTDAVMAGEPGAAEGGRGAADVLPNAHEGTSSVAGVPLRQPSTPGRSARPESDFVPGPWGELRATADWRRLLPAVHAGLGVLPGDAFWAAPVLGRTSCLRAALARRRPAAAVAAAAALASLGEGSTPAGDDYLMGVLYALWAEGGAPAELAGAIAAVAAARTTRGSAAWLLLAGRGEVGPAWRELLLALAAGDAVGAARGAAGVRALGHTSGAYSLRGFLDTLEVTTA
jgi:hypothetical protein